MKTNNRMIFNTLWIFILWMGFLLSSCQNNGNGYDASGTFEATEIIVSSEIMGKILEFQGTEGDFIEKGKNIVVIDSSNLELQKAQVKATIEALSDKRYDANPQVKVLKEQLKTQEATIETYETRKAILEKDQKRIKTLFKAEAATEKQMDDINGQIDILDNQLLASQNQKNTILEQINAHSATVAIQNRGITSERKPLEKQIDIIENQIDKCLLKNPISGIILTKYMEAGEYATIGKPLYKIADLSEMILRAYITGSQLSKVKVGQEVNVQVDDSEDTYKTYVGHISWIADEAEFTPKTIQTKDERANLVYAVKVKVSNDDFLKIGMYGEVIFK